VKNLSNIPPSQPTNPYPEDESINIDLDPLLSWSCSDPNGDNLAYNIYFGIDQNPALNCS